MRALVIDDSRAMRRIVSAALSTSVPSTSKIKSERAIVMAIASAGSKPTASQHAATYDNYGRARA